MSFVHAILPMGDAVDVSRLLLLQGSNDRQHMTTRRITRDPQTQQRTRICHGNDSFFDLIVGMDTDVELDVDIDGTCDLCSISGAFSPTNE